MEVTAPGVLRASPCLLIPALKWGIRTSHPANTRPGDRQAEQEPEVQLLERRDQ